MTIYNEGKMSRDMTYIDDIIQGLSKAVSFDSFTSETPFEIFNLGNNSPVSTWQLVQYIEKYFDKECNYSFQNSSIEVKETWANINKSEKFECNEKIFIDRTESEYNHCQIQNNIEISNFLNKEGFTSYKVGKLPFAKQIHLFKNAKVIVGAYGSAFANLLFYQENTKVIDIKPITHANYVDKKISRLNNLDFHLIETEILKDESKKKGDIFLKIEDLKQKL